MPGCQAKVQARGGEASGVPCLVARRGEVFVGVDEDQPLPAASPQRQHGAKHHAAVPAKHHGQEPLVEELPHPIRENASKCGYLRAVAEPALGIRVGAVRGR